MKRICHFVDDGLKRRFTMRMIVADMSARLLQTADEIIGERVAAGYWLACVRKMRKKVLKSPLTESEGYIAEPRLARFIIHFIFLAKIGALLCAQVLVT
ncbi:hypothetical protein LSTR_LSTR008215 [Laodelphax striatellus]|uniref:Uncharacterized protein n=1 Tax=Laodelphax striatellus TaxID=195883 RepID=A0A482WJ58_LAOST|nr:hypothetical protein LSTR_LSTR008215 [Laodelphax striatellus]